MFTPRKTAPEDFNPFWTKKGYGNGVSPCILGKPSRWVGSNLSNCVGYVYGRAWEVLGRQPNELNYTGAKKPGSAWTWYDQCQKHGLKAGSTPRLGAIACWKKIRTADGSIASGHVAFVEEVYSNGTCLVSESAYGGYKFRTSNKGKNMDKGETEIYKWIFQGFVYLLEEQPEEELHKLDKVEIVGRGYSNSTGKNGHKASEQVIGWKGVINRIINGAAYPYCVARNGIAIAWFKKEELKKC